MKLTISVIFVAFGLVKAQTWNYDINDATNGPNGWGGKCQIGTQQSPTNFETANLKAASEAPFTFKNYDKAPTTVTVKNDGHSIKVEFTASEAMTISGGGLPEPYTLAQFHFHWGNDNTKALGSEHTVDGVGFINEVHFVHYKSKFGAIGEALVGDEPNNNLAVIGAFFELSDTDNPDLATLITALETVGEKDGSVDVTPFAFDKFLPAKRNTFYRYTNGSLTTPGCSEVVFWTVLTEKVSISRAQMAKFQALNISAGKTLGNNYRPVQPLNGRDVFRVVGNSDCCPMKEDSTGKKYTLHDSDAAKTAKFMCSDACIYKSAGKKYCFKDDDSGMEFKCVAP